MKKSFKFLAVAALAVALVCSCAKGPKTVTLDFEGSNWDALVIADQANDNNLYGEGATNYQWSDGNSMLEFPGFPDTYGTGASFYCGGEVISNFVVADFTDADYTRQLEVPVAPKSGKNFIVHYGDADPTSLTKFTTAPMNSQIRFSDGVERVIKSIDICPTNFVINTCVNGNAFFGPLEGSTSLSLKAVGFDKNGSATKVATVKYLDANDVAGFKNGSKPVWKKWDLSGLGAVYGIIFCVFGTDDCYGDYGFNAPAYFAYDNIVVEMPAEK